MADNPVEDAGRSVVPDLVLEEEFLEKNLLSEVYALLKTQKWHHLFEEEVSVDEGLVKAFYEKFSMEEKPGLLLATFTIGDRTCTVTSRELALFLDVPHQGYGEYAKGQWPPSVAQEEVIHRVGKDVKTMSLMTRVVHRVVSQRVTPRLQKHNMVNFQDYILVDKLLLKQQVSLPMQVLHHMSYSVSTVKHGLPYPGFVKRILDRFDLYNPTNEVPAFIRFDLENCSRLGFKLDDKEGWVRKEEIPALKGINEHAAPAVDLSPVLHLLKDITGKVDKLTDEVVVLTKRVTVMEEREKKMDESLETSLVYLNQAKEERRELKILLARVGADAISELRKAIPY